MAWGAKVGKRMAAPLTSLNNFLVDQVSAQMSKCGDADHLVYVELSRI